MRDSCATKFKKNIYSFLAHDLPALITRERLVCPDLLLKDMILWQCIADKIIEFVIQDELISSQARKCSQARMLSSIEENAIRYAACYVIRKLLNSFKKTGEYDDCIEALISLFLDDVSSHRDEE